MIHLIGLGNPIHGDDGFGHGVIHALKQKDWPEQVRLLEGGIMGLDALPLLEGASHVVLIDSARGGTEKAGSVSWLSMGQLLDQTSADLPLVSHDFGVVELLRMLPFALEGAPPKQVDLLLGWVDGPQVFENRLSSQALEAVDQAVVQLQHYVAKMMVGECM
ncbi:hydrogenase maturation protease [Magnetococcus sp. PR-3]|uniref:hydrogenase maturation protease n=1 Tax=Magnetococcus sp. PR-3 TaxID=3120355 RepID=UPI002FCE0BF9